MKKHKINHQMRTARHGLYIFLAALTILISATASSAQDNKQVVRIARIKIDPAQLEQYKTALKEGIEAAIRLEAGVLALNAVADKNNPTDITILEVYADMDAYKKHIETSHFKKYKTTTKDMVKSLELIDVTPILLGSKSKK